MKQGSNDQRQGGVRSDASVVGIGPVAFSGCLGQCASTHNLYAAERPKDVWDVRRALLLPFGERADGPQGAGKTEAFGKNGILQALQTGRPKYSRCVIWTSGSRSGRFVWIDT